MKETLSMRGNRLLALASLLFCLTIGNQLARAEHTITCIPHFAEGFDGQTIWQTQLLLDVRAAGLDQTVINVFNSHGFPLRQVRSLDFRFTPGFRLLNSPFFQPVPLFGSFFFGDLLFPLRTGFLIVDSPGPLPFRALIRQFSLSGALLSELIIAPFDPFRRARLVSEEFDARVLAFALANADTLKRAFGRFDFFPLGSPFPLFSFPFDIGPRSQFSSFLFDMFPELAFGGLKGFIRITSDNPISLIAISADRNGMKQVPIVIEE